MRVSSTRRRSCAARSRTPGRSRSLMLTTEALVNEVPEEEKKGAYAGMGGGGMGGGGMGGGMGGDF